nr:T9SS type A sorting domain-containing protein [Nitrosopumilus sp.]
VFNNLAPGAVTGIKAKKDGCISQAANCSNSSCANNITTSTNQQSSLSETIIPIDLGAGTSVKAFPNPYNDRIRFVINSKEAGQGSLEVHNMLGQKVKTIHQGLFTAGTQTFELQVPNSQRSTLIYVLRLNGQQVTGKMLQSGE